MTDSNEQDAPEESRTAPLRPEAPPIPGPSRLVRAMRWWGLGLFVLGLVVALVTGQISDNETVRLSGPFLGILGMVFYLAATLLRLYQWRRGD